MIVTQKDQTATGDTGLFDMKSNTITLIGNVVVSQGKMWCAASGWWSIMTTGVSRVEAGRKGPVRMLIEQSKDGVARPQKPLKFPLSRN